MERGTGKRAKEYCNETCRSNAWYAKNKKGKKIYASPKPEYDSPKLPDNFKDDEPLKFGILEVAKDYDYFADRILKGDCEEPEGHQKFIREVKESGLPKLKKEQLIAASRISQS